MLDKDRVRLDTTGKTTIIAATAFARGDHAPGETVNISSIAHQAGRAAILMSRLATTKF